MRPKRWTVLCDKAPFGWWCSRLTGHDGPCAAYPRWYNVRARIRLRRP